ncbi:AI-2E family transporter [Enterovirga rhinocerotis]|uniref:Putative PurR-regulated permease PerM n=1 Tax=Enterovirga rhinocerotis TaxID=1339210 RepID=A0A4R7BPG7_9HYPH|nr:AI-2E family transporter [Enterovirga rhinocerotis]TDR87261.1 putative PurR-regulated permease PerM [Enterovirga rhinocerotis]
MSEPKAFETMPHDPPSPAQRRTFIVLCLLLLVAGLWTIRSFLPALGWAAILAVATWPLYARVRAMYPPRGHDILWPLVFSVAAALLVLVPLAAAGIQVAREAHTVLSLVEEARRSGLPPPPWLGDLPLLGPAALSWWTENLASGAAASGLIERFNHDAVAGLSRSLGGQLLHRSIVFGFTILTLFFLYRDGLWLLDALRRASERAIGPHGERIGRQMIASIHGTVDGLVLVGIGEGILIGIAYWFAGVPHPALFGAATAIAAMIPFGAAAVFCAAALLVLADGSVGAAVAIVAVGSIVVFVADHAVRPALIGGATKLPFLWVLIGILGGVETFGLLGLFLGPALMASLHLLWRDWIAGPADEVPAPPSSASAARR